MNDLEKIKCMMYRSGTSKGLYFLDKDLPINKEDTKNVLLKVMGSPDINQIDGLGGASNVTSKVAVISISKKEGIDIDYKFIQVMIDTANIDDKPTCGNILTAVGVFALERGLVNIEENQTIVKIYDVNTGAIISQIIQTPKRCITYKGNTKIAGVPNSASGISLFFKNITGGKTGHYLPTKKKKDIFNGIEVTCLDISMPVVFVKANDMNLTGYESPDILNANKVFFEKLENIREQASYAMGLGSAKGNVIPKIAIISSSKQNAHINIRYFTPSSAHPSLAVSAGFCVAIGSFIKGTLLHDINPMSLSISTFTIDIENPAGITKVEVNFPSLDIDDVEGKTIRTARLLFDGEVYI